MKRALPFLVVLATLALPLLASADGSRGWVKLPHIPSRITVNDPRNIRVEIRAEAFAELGAEDPRCLTQEWEWGDGNTSTQTSDCEPADPMIPPHRTGRFDHKYTYHSAGNMRIVFRLKRGDETIFKTNITLIISDGMEDVEVGGISSANQDQR